MEEFTLQDWAKTEREVFTIDPEVVSQLKAIMDQFHELAEKHNVPYVCHFVDHSDMDTFSMISGAIFAPIGRVPAELLAAYATCVYGLDEGTNVALSIMQGV